MVYFVLVLAAVALFMAWQSGRKQGELRERIAQVNSRVYNLRREVYDSQEELKQEITSLKFQLMQVEGKLEITGNMTVDEVGLIHPQANQVLAGFHIGGCSSCAVDGSQRLDLAVAQSGQQLEPVLVALNTLVQYANGKNGHETNGKVPDELLQTPNVELNL